MWSRVEKGGRFIDGDSGGWVGVGVDVAGKEA